MEFDLDYLYGVESDSDARSDCDYVGAENSGGSDIPSFDPEAELEALLGEPLGSERERAKAELCTHDQYGLALVPSPDVRQRRFFLPRVSVPQAVMFVNLGPSSLLRSAARVDGAVLDALAGALCGPARGFALLAVIVFDFIRRGAWEPWRSATRTLRGVSQRRSRRQRQRVQRGKPTVQDAAAQSLQGAPLSCASGLASPPCVAHHLQTAEVVQGTSRGSSGPPLCPAPET